MQDLFNQQFKFNINEPVRHRGDSHKDTSDLGLLILERHLIESLDAENKVVYERAYVCRMIRWSGSGDLARFNERELISAKDYEREKILDREETNRTLADVRRTEKEVGELFGVTKEDYLYEVVNGVADKTKKFRWSGFSFDENGANLHVTESVFTAASRKEESQKIKREDRKWTSKDQFEKAQ